MPSDKVYISAPFAKVNTTEDGGREVWGFATLEVVDKSGEIVDFNGTVDAFQKWSDGVSKRTGGKNLGNVRLMHQPITAGKTIHWEPSETTIDKEDGTQEVVKAIWVGAYVPPTKEDVIKDIDEGILSAFSIGGNYAKRWWDATSKAFRYVPDLSEYSFVDNPCVPGADFVNVITKADGPWTKPERNIGGEIVDENTLEKGGKPEGSYEQFLSRLDAELSNKFRGFNNWWDGYRCATYPDDGYVVIYNYDQCKYYKVPFTDTDGAIAIGDGVEEVQEITTYVPIEAQKFVEDELAKRKAKAEGDGGGKEVPVVKSKEENIVKAEDIAKAAEAAGLTIEQVTDFLTKLSPLDEAPDTIDVPTVDGDFDTDGNMEFPNGPEGSEVIDIPGGIDSVKEAEKATTIKSALIDMQKGLDTFAKGGKAISAKNAMHLEHAKNHIEAALNGTDYGPDKHLEVEGLDANSGPNTGMESPEVTEKIIMSALQKGADSFFKADLAKMTEQIGKMEALFKGVATSDSLTKAMTSIEEMSTMVKAIHDAPQEGGPVLTGGNPLVARLLKGEQNTGDVEEQVITNLIKITTDPMLKDKLGMELALRQAKQIVR